MIRRNRMEVTKGNAGQTGRTITSGIARAGEAGADRVFSDKKRPGRSGPSLVFAISSPRKQQHFSRLPKRLSFGITEIVSIATNDDRLCNEGGFALKRDARTDNGNVVVLANEDFVLLHE